MSLSSVQPQAESQLRASLTDPDGIVGSVLWVWQRSTNRSSWSTVSGADSAAYTPGAGDVGMWLRAAASYDDGHSLSKSANKVSANKVSANKVQDVPVTNGPPEFPATETGSALWPRTLRRGAASARRWWRLIPMRATG